MQKKHKRQIPISTHSTDLLSDRGIGGEEVLMLGPDVEGTQVVQAASIQEIRQLMLTGMSAAEAIFPHTEPKRLVQLEHAFAKS